MLLQSDLYVTSAEEVLWGGALLAVTIAIHGTGMSLLLALNSRVKPVFEKGESIVLGVCTLIVLTWGILIIHLLEVALWGAFYYWKSVMPTVSRANYFALMDYTTLGSEYEPPINWRLLRGMIAIAGLLTFAWSTGVLYAFGQEFQLRVQAAVQKRRTKQSPVRS